MALDRTIWQRTQQDSKEGANIRAEEQAMRAEDKAREQSTEQKTEDMSMSQANAKKKTKSTLLPQRVSCDQLRTMPVQHMRTLEQARRRSSPEKIM